MKSFVLGVAFCLFFTLPVLAGDFSGKYDSENGTLQIKQLDSGKIDFSVSTADADCTGEITNASASLASAVATFTGENSCKVVIEFKGEKEAVVREENCSFYHGARCSFDATYAKKSGMPKDVNAFLLRNESCQHWSGEKPYDKDRAKEIKTAINKLKCNQLDADTKKLQKKYANKPDILKAIK